jgi:deazaflavin-dependent oxidoreductase (nitroreductase family)
MARLAAPVYRVIGWFSTTRLDRVLHPFLYRRTGGRGLLGHVLGCETILVTAPGARSGAPRTVALFGFAIDRGWFVVASRGGSGRIPAWYRNIAAARDRITVQVGDQVIPVVARDTDGDEYEAWFARAARAYDGYRIYREAAGHRIPVVALERTPGSEAAA